MHTPLSVWPTWARQPFGRLHHEPHQQAAVPSATSLLLVAGIASPKCGQVSFPYGMSSAWEETYIFSPLMEDEGKTGSFFWLCLSLWPLHTGGCLLLLHWDLLCHYQVKQQCLNAKMSTVCSLVYNGSTVSPFVCLGPKQHCWKKNATKIASLAFP